MSVILEGVGATDEPVLTDEQRLALASTIHGAGRAMSRSRAKGKVQRRWVPDPDAVEEVNRLPRSITGMPRGSDARRETGGRIEHLRRRGHWDENVIRPGEISRDDMIGWLGRQPWGRVDLRGADTDEAPQAYKRIEDVLAAHEGTVRVLHRLYPIGVAMAGPDIVDPYKD